MGIFCTRWFVTASVAIVLVSMLVWQFAHDSNNTVPDLLKTVAVDPPRSIEPFNLTDHKMSSVSVQRFTNHWTFVFFGFTNCPDVCPATLTQLVTMNNLLKQAQRPDSKIQFFFVSVDPERDSISHLAEYIAFFDSTFIAMTGEEEELRGFESALGAFHRVEEKRPDGHYNVLHSADIFLIDPSGHLTAKFTPPMDLALVVRQFDLIVQQYTQRVT